LMFWKNQKSVLARLTKKKENRITKTKTGKGSINIDL
jgi:hypothetical protein